VAGIYQMSAGMDLKVLACWPGRRSSNALGQISKPKPPPTKTPKRDAWSAGDSGRESRAEKLLPEYRNLSPKSRRNQMESAKS